MLISMNWISDFVDLKGLDVESLIKRFTLSTAEVEDIYHKGEDIENVVAGKILTIENHPKSKKLHLLTVDGGDKIYDVVCGAPNVRVGMIVPFAREGGKAGGMDIVKATIAGYDSYGMCCSESELGISADHSGLMELDPKTKVGTSIKDILPIDDIVFEVDNKSLTNRPDLWGHYGIAREFAALTGRRLKPLPVRDLSQYDALPEVPIEVVDTEHCYRYSSIKVENISEKTSPAYMRIRLFYCGMRAINLLADLTNYLMLEMGQPMHAFDLRKVDKIEVKRFDESFDFETLDQTVRKIDPDTLMICSGGAPVAIAGIMGGYESEIADDTSSLLIESANFDGISVRKSTVRLGLRTDSSMRYEKMLDPEMTVPAIGRYIELLLKINPGARIISRLSDSYVKHYDTIHIDFDKKLIDRYTGISITNAQIVKTLHSLGFEVTNNRSSFSVTVPSWRSTKDVTIKADVVEEITRIYGYDNFEIKTASSPLYPVRSSDARICDYAIKQLLCDRFSLHEVHSYIWNDQKKLKELSLEVEDNVKLINSINPDQVVLRRSIMPSLLTFVGENLTYSGDFGIFEIGSVCDGLRDSGECNELKRLGICLFSSERSEKELFLRLKDMIISLFSRIKNATPEFSGCEVTHAWQHPANMNAISINGKRLGELYPVLPSVVASISKKASVVCAELDVRLFDSLDKAALPFKEPSRFPGVYNDVTLLMDSGRPFSDIAKVIDGYECAILQSYNVVDIFDEQGALSGKKAVTVRLNYSSEERTLTGDEAFDNTKRIVGLLGSAGIVMKQ